MRKVYIRLLTILFICLVTIGLAEASTKTKHLTVGDINLAIEAPLGMCFVDKGSPSLTNIYNHITEKISDRKQKQIIAIFAPCHKLATAVDSLNLDNIMDNFAYISWLYPSFASYYDKGSKQFIEDILDDLKNKGRGGFKNLDNGVATLLKQSQKVDDKITEEVILVGYTILRNIPIEIRINDSMEHFKTANEAYSLLNKFINYQIKLNETN